MSEVDPWLGSVQGMRSTPPPVISLLGSEPYANSSGDSIPFRSTTYDGKETAPAQFSDGSIYVKYPREDDKLSIHGSVAIMDGVTLPQLYVMGYRSYRRKRHVDFEQRAPQLCPPPDFDSSAPTNADAVAQYVRGLAQAHNHIQGNPTPFRMYEHMIIEAYENLSVRPTSACADSDGAESDYHVGADDWRSSGPLCYDPQIQSEASNLSLMLASLQTLGTRHIHVLVQKLLLNPQVAVGVFPEVISASLQYLSTFIADAGQSPDDKAQLCCLLGMLTSPRGDIKEVIEYLNVLEDFKEEHPTAPIPSIQIIAHLFSFHSKSLIPITSPLDCYQENSRPTKVSLPEGVTVQCFDTSRDGRSLAVATLSSISVYDIATGYLRAERELPEGNRNVWDLNFSEDAEYIICTDSAGLKHNIYTVDLESVEEYFSTEVSVPYNFKDGALAVTGAPQLPSGHKESLHIFSKHGPLVTVHDESSDARKDITICAHVYRDFRGALVKLYADGDEELSVEFTEGVIHLTQGQATASGAVNSISPWYFVHVKWTQGVWELAVNSAIIELRGPRTGQPKTICIRKAACLDGEGHIGSLAIWSSAASASTTAVGTYCRERRIVSSVRPLVNIPLDEGQGMWIKETVSAQPFPVVETQFVWDDHLQVPCNTPTTAAHNPVRLDAKLLLDGRVLTSAFKAYVILPSTCQGADDVILEVDRESNTIQRVYRCPPSCSRFSILWDESELFEYHQRFATFSVTSLHTHSYKKKELAANHLLDCSVPSGSVSWLLHEWYMKMYVESTELHRIPPEHSPLSLSNLVALTESLQRTKHTTNKLRVLATLSLILVHFKQLPEDEEKMQGIALSLKSSCMKIMDIFTEDVIQKLASDVLQAATLRSLTLRDRVNALLDGDIHKGATIIRTCMTTETLVDAVYHIVSTTPEKIDGVTRRLMAMCMQEEEASRSNRSGSSCESGTRTITHLLLWYTLACAKSLLMNKNEAEVARLSAVFATYITELSEEDLHNMSQWSVMHTGCIPLFIVLAKYCPGAITPEVEQRITQVLIALNTLPGEEVRVPFSTCEACNVFPTSKDPEKMWRFILDFSGATSVSVLKETSTPTMSIVNSDKTSTEPMRVQVTSEQPFVKLDGGPLILYGVGQNAFTIVAQHDFTVDVSWSTLLRETIHHLLISYATYLTEKPNFAETFVPPLVRHGLTTEALRAHGIEVTGRGECAGFAMKVLRNSDEGEEYVDKVCKNMRGSILPSMRPSIQALLSILVHSGANSQQAEDELKLRWFSGEWGSKLQGPSREGTADFLQEMASWVVHSVMYHPETPSISMRRGSVDRRHELSLNCSRSMSERRGSTSSRRSLMKSSVQYDTLDQLKTLLSREVTSKQLEIVLAERTRTCMKMAHGLSILMTLLSLDNNNNHMKEDVLLPILGVLWHFANVDKGTHFIDSLAGAGVDLEMKVRTAFHSVLSRCQQLLLGNCRATIAPQAVLSEPALNGKATMLLLAIMCHPWDSIDCELMNTHFGMEFDVLRYLEDQMSIPTSSLTLDSPWGLRRDRRTEEMHEAMERSVRAELMGSVDLNTLSRMFPNDFSIVIPQFQMSRSDEGILIEKSSSSSTVLRADEGWPLSWKDGIPRVFYFEVKLNASISSLEIGLFYSKTDVGIRGTSLPYFYNSNGETHTITFPTFGEGDVVGCGVVATSRRIFLTLNGKFLSYVGVVSETHDVLFPTLRFDEKTGVKVLINFGTSPFAYDYRLLHPALSLENGPTWYRVASTAEIALHYITTRVCTVQETKRPCTRVFLSHCCEVVCRNVNKVTSSLMSLGVGTSPKRSAGTRIKQAVILSVAEYSIMILISTMKQMVNTGTVHTALPEVAGQMIFDAVSVLMLLPLHTIQISTISLLPEVIPHITHFPDSTTSANLVQTLFDHANSTAVDTKELIPFVPMWCECDSRCMSIANVQFASMIPESQRSIVLGSVLPRTGTVSFSVTISRRNMSKGHSLKGGYFIGISIAGLTPLSPTSNSQSWKAVKPPIVWAIHDTSPQLPHATNPTVKPNNFQRTFGNDDIIRVVVDRDKKTIDFYRDGEFLKTLFSDIPSDLDLVPFAQMYNDDASAVISPGEMVAPISAPTLLSATSVDVLRAMLALEPFENLVANGICSELETENFPKVALALFNSLPDPRLLQLRSASGEELMVSVTRLGDMRCKFSVGNETNYEHIYNMRTPANPKITCSFDSRFPVASFGGLSRCIERLVAAVRRIVVPLITVQALACLEVEERQRIIYEEKERWDFLFYGLRMGSFINIHRASQLKSLIPIPRIPNDYSFSAALSHPSFNISPHYCGKLATVPSGSKNLHTPFIAIAEPSLPMHGKFSIRCQLIRGHSGQILGGGYYFGVCTSTFNWRRKDLNSSTPEVWAIHDMDDAPWRLRHLCPTASFPITAEPRCIIVSGDIIRLEINRDEGTLYAYRKPMNGDEICLGLLYENIPPGPLYPFVHLFNYDAVAVLLPSNSLEPAVRLTVQKPNFSVLTVGGDRRYCDGCAALHLESRLTHHWYKCNECADYALCKNCFDLCVHCYHPFTEMGASSFVHSISPPTYLMPTMEVVIPATSCMYLRSSGCRMFEHQMNCVVEATEDNAYAVWGLVCKGRGQFTVVVETTDNEPLSTDHPMFIGVGGAEDIMRLSKEKLRSKCFSAPPSLVAYCSDPTLRRKMDNESRSPYGFSNGSRITLDVDMTKRTVSILRDWIVVGTRPAEFTRNPESPLCCFIVFGRKNVRASILPERAHTINATVEETNGSVVKVTTPDGPMRYVTADNCRLPLKPCVLPPDVGQLGYSYVKNEMMQCRVAAVEKDSVKLCIAQDSEQCSIVPINHFMISAYNNAISEERLSYKESRDFGPSLEQGFVVSRLLLILSCLCESESLSPLVMQHTSGLISMIKGLASVQIDNEAPLDFLGEIRMYVTSTANCMSLNQRLGFFVPTLGIDVRKRKFKPLMLVRPVNSPTSPIYRVVSRKGDMLSLENITTSEKRDMSYKECIPVKQSAGRPWYTLENGLPCSFLEHTMRVSSTQNASKNVSIGGQWQGEFALASKASITVEMKLLEDSGVGEAALYFSRQPLTYLVMYDHNRYGRVARMCMVRHDVVTPELEKSSMSYADKVDFVKRMINTGGEVVLHIEVDIDAEGLRMTGSCRTDDGRVGTFVCNWTNRTTFAPVTTAIAHLEPLPDCVDAVIPVLTMPDVCDTMRRLIVLLARHLYLVVSNKVNNVSKEFIEQIFLFATHPLTDRLVTHFVGVPQLFFMLCDACQLIVDPTTKPWDAANLASLLNKTLLLRPEVSSLAPESLVWDALHAAVVAAHRCGSQYRSDILRNITTFVQHHASSPSTVYEQLFSTLFSYINRAAQISTDLSEGRKDVSAGVDLILTNKFPVQSLATNIPTAPLHCLVDIYKSLDNETELPKIVDIPDGDNAVSPTEEVFADSAFGDFKDNELKVGKMMSSRPAGASGKYYFEVVLPDRLNSPFAVGWGTKAHCDVPSQHVGSDHASFSYNGSEVTTKDFKEEYKIANEIMPGAVVGCLLNMDEKTVAWSINGTRGALIAIPIALGDECLYIFASIGTCNGMRVRLQASEFEYVPDEYTDLCRRYTRVLISSYKASERSSQPVRSIAFYTQLASYLSDVEEHREDVQMSLSLSATVMLKRPRDLYLPKYPIISGMSEEEIQVSSRVISTIESCMATASRFVDLDGDTVSGTLSLAFMYLKSLVRRSFRRKLLIDMPGVEKVNSPPPISIRITELYSTLPRTPEVALQHTVLSQLYKQIGSFTEAQWSLSPLFKVNLYISGSGHAPIDMGGPYRQLWTFLAEEIMRHPDRCYPHSDFHRNPLFTFVNNSQRVSLVPDSMANSSYDLTLFNFFGKIMGHAARAKFPLDIDFSTFFWKFLVDDLLTINDYYQHVDGVVQTSMEDDNFLLSGIAEELIPGYAENILWVEEETIDEDKLAQRRRNIAENCLVHSMDEQLGAIRSGLWSTLPRRVARCLSWKDLEKLVCGESNPSVEDMKRYIRPQINTMREKYFWQIVEEMSGEQKAALLCFASGQRRLPLIRPISIQENSESVEHLPRAQSCSSLMTIPMYATLDAFRQKLLIALGHQTEMELA